MRNAYNILAGKPEGRDHLRGFGVDWIILKLKRQGLRV
jgi:hypothetical protein